MNKILGKSVINAWSGGIRYGLVKDISQKEDGWAYVLCDWIKDHQYEDNIENICSLRNMKREDFSDWLRIDKVTVIDIRSEIDKLIELYEFSEERNGF